MSTTEKDLDKEFEEFVSKQVEAFNKIHNEFNSLNNLASNATPTNSTINSAENKIKNEAEKAEIEDKIKEIKSMFYPNYKKILEIFPLDMLIQAPIKKLDVDLDKYCNAGKNLEFSMFPENGVLIGRDSKNKPYVGLLLERELQKDNPYPRFGGDPNVKLKNDIGMCFLIFYCTHDDSYYIDYLFQPGHSYYSSRTANVWSSHGQQIRDPFMIPLVKQLIEVDKNQDSEDMKEKLEAHRLLTQHLNQSIASLVGDYMTTTKGRINTLNYNQAIDDPSLNLKFNQNKFENSDVCSLLFVHRDRIEDRVPTYLGISRSRLSNKSKNSI